MRHSIEIKMPKLFGKKEEPKQESTVKTEIDLDKNEEKLKQTVKTVGIAVGALAIGYMAGHHRGVLSQANKIIVIK